MFWDRRPTAAWRLALPVMLVFAVGAAAVMAAMYMFMAEAVRGRGDRWLAGEVQGVAALLASGHGEHLQQELDGELEELLHHELLDPVEEDDRSQSLFFLAVVGPGGRTLARAASGNGEAMGTVLARALAVNTRVSWVRVEGWEYPVRVARATLPQGRVVVAGSTPFGDLELLEDVRDIAVDGWLAVLAVGALVSWLSARRVLARVEVLADAAREMGGEDLARRLPSGPRGDEIDRMSEAFNGLLQRIEAAVKQLRVMADGVAHDLRTPLTSIRGALEAAAAADGCSGVSDALEGAISQVDHLVELVDSSLAVAEAEAGALPVNREELDLTTLAAELVELYGPLAEEAGIVLDLEAPGPVRMEGDPALLRRALANLLDNVVAHLPSGSRAVVRVGFRPPNAVLEVEDDGPGFPAEIRDRAFERMVKGPGSGGNGLGLAVVRAVALAHGGTVELRKPAAGGSVVRLILPR